MKNKKIGVNFLPEAKNCKGAEKVISMYWFAILFIVAGGIYGVVTTFYHHPYDIRSLEANVLGGKVADCISHEGELNSNLYMEEKFNFDFSIIFNEECNLNFNVEEQWEDGQYLVVVEFFNINEDKIFEFSSGNLNLQANCEIEDEDYERLAKCETNKFYSTSQDRQFLIKILSVVGKVEKNVK